MKRIRCRMLPIGVMSLLIGGSSLAAPTMRAENPGGPTSFPSSGTVLYSQLSDTSGDGAPDQAFEASYSAYDSQGADDFELTFSAFGWDITGLHTPGMYGGSIYVNVAFYADDGGMPADTPTCEFLGVTDYTDSQGSLSINLPTCILQQGVHWVSQQVRQDYAISGQHFWSNRTVQTGNAAVWRNPAGGFGIGCVDWTPMSVCGVGGGHPDFLFEILGKGHNMSFDIPFDIQVVPGVGPIGMLITVLTLGVAGTYVLWRRRG